MYVYIYICRTKEKFHSLNEFMCHIPSEEPYSLIEDCVLRNDWYMHLPDRMVSQPRGPQCVA